MGSKVNYKDKEKKSSVLEIKSKVINISDDYDKQSIKPGTKILNIQQIIANARGITGIAFLKNSNSFADFSDIF